MGYILSIQQALEDLIGVKVREHASTYVERLKVLEEEVKIYNLAVTQLEREVSIKAWKLERLERNMHTHLQSEMNTVVEEEEED